MPKFIRCDVLPINRRKQPVRGDEAVWGYGVYSKSLLEDGFSVQTQQIGVFRDRPAADRCAAVRQ